MKTQVKKTAQTGIVTGMLAAMSMTGSGCLGTAETTATSTASSAGNITLQSNPLAGASAASLMSNFPAFAWVHPLIGIQDAHAGVSSFSKFKLCLGEVVFETLGGTSGSSKTPLKPGLIDFSPTSEVPLVLGKLDIAADTQLKNLKFTIEKVPSLCQNAEFAVLFNTGTGSDITITQNTSFKFDFGAAGLKVADGSTITLYLGDIVNAMVSQASTAAGLTNETIQVVSAGQAK